MKRSTAGAFAFYQKRSIAFSGGHREDVTPVPIPNTEVKSLIGEGTARFAGGRVARCRVFTELDSERSQALFLFLGGTLRVNEPLRGGRGARWRVSEPLCGEKGVAPGWEKGSR